MTDGRAATVIMAYLVNIQDLPDELLVELFCFLPTTSVNSLCRTNVNLSRFSNDPQVRMSTLIKLYSNYSQEDLLALYKLLLADHACWLCNQQESLAAVIKVRPEWLATSITAGIPFRPCTLATLANMHWLLASISTQDLREVFTSSSEDHVAKGLFILSNAQPEINLPGDSVILRSRGHSIIDLELCAALIDYGLDLNVYLDRCEISLLGFLGAEVTAKAWMLLSLTSGGRAVVAENYDDAFRQAIYASGRFLSAVFNLLLALGADPKADLLTYRDSELREYMKEVAEFTRPLFPASHEAVVDIDTRMEVIGGTRSMVELCKRGGDFLLGSASASWDDNPGYHIYRSSVIPYTDKRWTELVDLYLRRWECVTMLDSLGSSDSGISSGLSPKDLYVYSVTNPVFFLNHRGRNYSIVLPYEKGRGFFTALNLWSEDGLELDLLLSGTYIANVGSKVIESLYGFSSLKEDILLSQGVVIREIQTKKYRLEFVVPETEETYVLQCQSDEYRKGISLLLRIFGYEYCSSLE